jgi:outer membrane lipase/esterase
MTVYALRSIGSVVLSAAAAVALPLQAQAQDAAVTTYTRIVIFGDSLSDSGNNGAFLGVPGGFPQTVTSDAYVPSLPYVPSGVYSNGPVWASSFASQLGLAALPSQTGGSNYAYGGAVTSGAGFPFSLTAQMATYLASAGAASASTTLFVVAGGGNNARAAASALPPAPTPAELAAAATATAAAFASDIGNIVDSLQAVGAQRIVVWDVPNLGKAPAILLQGAGASFVGSLFAQTMNSALAARLTGEAGVSTFDIYGLVGQISANPGAYGFTNTTNACVVSAGCSDASKYIFWDGIHPSAAAHQVIANAMVASVVPEPGMVWLMMAGLVGIGAVLRQRRA